jgi:hypothetical protein
MDRIIAYIMALIIGASIPFAMMMWAIDRHYVILTGISVFILVSGSLTMIIGAHNNDGGNTHG